MFLDVMDNNYEADAQAMQQTSGDSLKMLTKEAENVVELTARIKTGTELLKNLKKEVEESTRVTIPELMDEVGISSLELRGGKKLTLKPFVEATIPAKGSVDRCRDEDERENLKTRREEGFEWLENNEGGALITNVIQIPIPKGDEEALEDLKLLLEHHDVDFTYDKTVHPATLKKFIKEKLEMAVDVPKETFNLFQGVRAEVK